MKSPCHSFLNPRALISPFCKHQTPYEFLISLCHLATSSLSIWYPLLRTSLRRLTLRATLEHGPEAISLFSTWHGPEELFSPLHRVALWDKEPLLLKYLVILHFRPWRPRGFHLLRVERPLVPPLLLLSASMRLGDQLLHKGQLLRTLRVQCRTLLPRGPGLQAQTSHPELHSLSLQ